MNKRENKKKTKIVEIKKPHSVKTRLKFTYTKKITSLRSQPFLENKKRSNPSNQKMTPNARPSVGSMACGSFRRHETATNLPKMNIIKPGQLMMASFRSLGPLDTCLRRCALQYLRKGFLEIAPFAKLLLKGFQPVPKISAHKKEDHLNLSLIHISEPTRPY